LTSIVGVVNNLPGGGAPVSFERMRPATAGAGEAGPANGAELSRGILPDLLGYRLRRAQRAVFDHFARAVDGEELTPGLFGMLQVIAANPGLSQSRLAEAMGVDRSTIVAVMHRLEALGLVARLPVPRDGRSWALRMTRKGAVALRRIEALVRRHEDEVAAVFTPAERRTLMSLLARLYDEPQTTPR
jgi:DNA-binding MarR family transcriptional regulator